MHPSFCLALGWALKFKEGSFTPLFTFLSRKNEETQGLFHVPYIPASQIIPKQVETKIINT